MVFMKNDCFYLSFFASILLFHVAKSVGIYTNFFYNINTHRGNSSKIPNGFGHVIYVMQITPMQGLSQTCKPE